MKKALLALALTVAAVGTASAHSAPSTHYHNDNGTVVYGNRIAPQVTVSNETDRWGRDIRVTTTVRCVDHRVNRRNNHIRCVEESTSVTRELVRQTPPAMPAIEPVVYRNVVTDNYGRRFVETTTFSCTRSGYQAGRAVCYNWERNVTRVPEAMPAQPVIEPVVYRNVVRDNYGNRFIEVTTYTCNRSGYQDGKAVCYGWDRDVTRKPVRWNRDRNVLDLDGDGRTDAWERLLYEGFREVLESN